MSKKNSFIDTAFIFKYRPDFDKNLIAEAFDLCKDKDRAVFMVDLIIKAHLGSKLILAAILIDVSEAKIRQNFGNEIANLVFLGKKLTAINLPANIKKEYDEEVTTMLVALAEDVRVLFLFLVYTVYLLEYKDNFSQAQIKHILRFGVPIAYRLNNWKLKTHLEDLCLQRLFPEKYIWLERQLKREKEQRENYMNYCLDLLQKAFDQHHLKISANGRVKNIYSIYKKIEFKKIEFNEIYDLIALRVVVNSVEECYQALGIVHSLWMPLVERIKDYIAVPKNNNYRAIHTTVTGPDGQYIEVQIRTQEMDREANFGIAAHWTYAQNKRSTIDKKEQSRWIKSLLNLQSENSQLELENMSIPFYRNNIFVFTQEGCLFRLPKGSTPLDLAYQKSTYTGNHLYQVEINGKKTSINIKLQNTDCVNLILSDKPTNFTKKDLLNLQTEKAHQKISEQIQM